MKPSFLNVAFYVRTLMLMLLIGAVTAPAARGVTILGVESGQTLRGPVTLGATGDDRTVSMTLQLIGPEGFTLVGTHSGASVSLVSNAEGQPGVWNAADHPAGDYTLIATARRAVRTHGRLVSASVSFRVAGATSAPVSESAPAPAVSPSKGETVEVTVSDGGTGNVASSRRGMASPRRRSSSVSAPSSDGGRRQPSASTPAVSSPRVDASGIDTSTRGSDRESAPVARVIEPSSAPVIELSDNNGVTPTVSPTQGHGLNLDVATSLPRGAVVEVEAWSIDEGRLVHAFAHALDGQRMEIAADRLRQLPEGRVELELTAVVDGQRMDPVYQTISVEEALVDAGNNGGLTIASAAPTTGGGGSVVSPRVTPSTTTSSSRTGSAGNTAPATAPLTGRSNNGGVRPVTTSGQTAPSSLVSNGDGGGGQGGYGNVTPAATGGVTPSSSPTTTPPSSSAGDTAPVDLDGLDATGAGFTVFGASSDTKTVYVSSTGNDANGGLSPASPVKTFAKAYGLIRDGKPDHIRFKAGDTFDYGLGVFNKSGRSADEPIVLGVFGEGPRPKFEVPEGSFVSFLKNDGSVSNVSIQGLRAEASSRNPNRPGFKPNAADRSDLVHKQAGVFGYGDIRNIVIEDCYLEWFKDAMIFQGKPEQNLYIKNVTLRRNVVINSYCVKEKGHSQGLYAELVDGLTLEENFFDHNGWSTQVDHAYRTKFNHNAYIQHSCLNVKLTGNVFSRGSSHGAQVRPGGEVVNNLFVRNALATFVAKSPSLVANNVILQSDDIGPDDPRGYGIGVLPGPDTRVVNNVISQKHGSAYWAEAIGLELDKNNLTHYSGPTKVELSDNKIYHWPIEHGRELPIRYGIPDAVLSVHRNMMDMASGSESEPAWIDPARDVESYMLSLNRPATFEAFARASSARPRGQWLNELSANSVNRYIRRGFDMPMGD